MITLVDTAQTGEPKRLAFKAPFRPAGYAVVAVALTSTSILLEGDYLFFAVALAVAITFGFVIRLIVRVSAAEEGLWVVNWGQVRRVPWQEIDGFEVVHKWMSQLVGVRLRDGRLVRLWATAGGVGGSGASFEQREHLVAQLEVMRERALGIIDSPELADALAAAERGDPEPLDHLLAAHKISAALYTERLHALAEAGKLDIEALRLARRSELS